MKAYGQISLSVINDGKPGASGTPALNVSVGNESQNIPCNNDGLVLKGFTIEIPYVAYIGFDRANCTASVGTLPNGIVLNSISDSTDDKEGVISLNVLENSDLGGKDILSGKIVLTFTLNEKKFIKYFNWTKTKDGQNVRFYSLESSTLILSRTSDDKLVPESITFSSFYKDGSSTEKNIYNGRFVIGESIDGTTFLNKYISSQDENTKIYTPSSIDIKMIKCTLFASGGTLSELDSQTVTVLLDNIDLLPEITQIKTSISELSLKVDKNTLEITQKASKTDIETAINNYDGSTMKTVRDQLAEQKLSLNSITNTISDVKTTLDKKADGSTVQALSEQVSKTEQNLDGFKTEVSKNYVSHSELNNLDLGASNLLVGTQFWDNSFDNKTKDPIKEVDFSYIRCFESDLYTLKKFNVLNFKKISISFDARSPETGNAEWIIEFYQGSLLKERKFYPISFSDIDKWLRFYSVIDISTNIDNIVIKFTGERNTVNYVDYRKLKIISGIGDNYWSPSVDDLENRFSRNEAQITVNADAIKNKIWSSDIQREISNIEIGAVNLILDSGDYKKGENVQWISLTSDDWKIETLNNSLKITKLTSSESAWLLIPLVQTLENNKPYTFTSVLKSNKSKDITIYLVDATSENQSIIANESFGKINVNTTYGNVKLTHTIIRSGFDFIALKGNDFSLNDYLEFENIMLEQGSIASDWRENDTEIKLKLDSRIEKVNETVQNLDGTLSTVSKKVDTAVQSEEMDKYLQGLVGNDELKQQLEDLKNTFNKNFVTQSQLNQTAGSINASIQMAGGYNLIKNSIGLGITKNNTMTNWNYINPTNIKVYSVQGSSFSIYGGESEIVIESLNTTGGSFYQDITTTPGITYTIAMHINPSNISNVKLKIIDVTSNKTISSNLFSEASDLKINNYNYFYAPIKAQGNITRIQFEVIGSATLHIAGLRLVIGNNPLQWTLSSGESYSANVRMDVEGITVYHRDDTSSFTRMSPDEFAIYANNDRVAWAAEDEFHMKKAVIEDSISLGNILMQTVKNTSLPKNRRGVLFISQSI